MIIVILQKVHCNFDMVGAEESELWSLHYIIGKCLEKQLFLSDDGIQPRPPRINLFRQCLHHYSEVFFKLASCRLALT